MMPHQQHRFQDTTDKDKEQKYPIQAHIRIHPATAKNSNIPYICTNSKWQKQRRADDGTFTCCLNNDRIFETLLIMVEITKPL